MSNLLARVDQPSDHRLSVQELSEHFQSLVLSMMLSLRNGQLVKDLGNKEVIFAIEGSRHFRAPKGLGEMRYEGCEIAVFAGDLGGPRDAFFKDAARLKLKTEEIEHQRVVILQEKLEEDLWTIYVAFPRANMVAVATDRNFLQRVLARMRSGGGQKAFPETLPEWKQIDRNAQFWGVRHFGREDADKDPTSPYRDDQLGDMRDKQAIGLTYQCDPNRDMKVILTYLTKEKDAIKIAEQWFPVTGEPNRGDTAGLHIQYHESEPGIVKGIYDVSRSGPLNWFVFVLLDHLGHAILV